MKNAIILLLLLSSVVHAQGDDDGLGPAPKEALALVARSVEAMGGKRSVASVKNAMMTVRVKKKGGIQERHTIKIKDRVMHYASRRASGAGFDVVVGGPLAFLADRSKAGQATYVADLPPNDAREGGYERDVLFLPLLLPRLMKKSSRMDYRGKNSKGHEVVRLRLTPHRRSRFGRPFTVRLLFDRDSNHLISVMGVVPWGDDKGKKRYCLYEDYKKVRLPRGGHVSLPHKMTDKRGSLESKGRVFEVRWKLNAKLPEAMFVKPRVAKSKSK